MTEFDVLRKTMVGEARGEPIDGLIAVGCVIRNRVLETGKTYKEVCTQGVDLYHHQFSCWNENDPNFKVIQELNSNDPIVREINYLAIGIQNGTILDNTHGSNHYLTTLLFRNNPPSWAKGIKEYWQLGHQIFFYCK